MNQTGGHPPVVVGIDGSATALRAALWAVDEAVSRDVPLRLLCAIDPAEGGLEDAAHRLATAEIAVRYACTAVESTERPVRVEIEVAQDNPRTALLRASTSAALLCVGDVGFRHFTDGHVGSTTEVVAAHAQCPVAIIRDARRGPAGTDGRVLAFVEESTHAGAVTEAAVAEAVLRRCGLQVTAIRRYADDHTVARLERALDQWRRRYPDLPIDVEVVTGEIAGNLARLLTGTRLAVAAAGGPAMAELFSAAGYAAIHDSGCTLLIVNDQRAL